jgi:hypothetical protein
MQPFFYACKNGKDLYIVSRGPADFSDFLLIVDFEVKEFQGGQVHGGVDKAARWIIQECRKYIDACTGKIICAGHSLGGSLSGMAAAILVLEEQKDNVEAVCLGPLPIFSASLIPRVKDFITTFVYRNDVVPRLTAKFLAGAVHHCAPPTLTETNTLTIILQGMFGLIIQGIMMQNRNGAYDHRLFRNLEAQVPAIVARLVEIFNEPDRYEFDLPGVVHLLVSDKDGCNSKCFEECDRTFTCHSLLSSVCDHNIQNYEDALFALDCLN